ncbi:MAG: bifunctional phosphopantothenoylcysteine decarboxylase/phosphopantothenate--cysteine ligase CoaBC [Dehalococcoidales bacterium]|nr:bifunctional phosphopantothenoylcysteine decarboxylase/phosphopantothenate--cysteine ligase CoaBC [Dehalococcoidales bacterium]
MLNDKTVVLGVSGSIAVYKAADLASKLTQAGAKVNVIMTESATRLVAPLTFHSLTDRPVVTSMWQAREAGIGHITLADTADIVVIAPATANTIARLAAGIADDMLTATVLATRAPVIIAPAMHTNMFRNQITQDNLARLRARGFTIVGPARGRLASGATGEGRLVEIGEIIDAIEKTLQKSADLSGKRIVVTAGGTQEPIDPARHIGNRSSGKMGFALAEAARDRGAEVTLITAPSHLPEPGGVAVVRVTTAAEMKAAVAKAVKQADALIMAAAVADYQPKSRAQAKIKKQSPEMTLELVRTPDILSEVTGSFIKVGFAAESEDLVANAQKKLKQKGLDLIVANDITEPESGFGADTNKVTMIDKEGNAESLPLMSKREVAERILDKVAGMGENPP